MITDRALIRILPAIPKPLVQFAAAPYVAGTSIADATDACDGLATTGRTATLDFLGEEVRNHHEIEAIRDTYVHLISAIREHQPDATVSVKPSALGLRRSYATCVGYLRDILDCGVFVRLDMEDATLTDRTLRLYTHLRQTGHDNLGLALQAYLRRTIDDVKAIARYQPNVRLCKGIYIEAAEIAFKDPDAIRQNYLRILNELASIEGTHIAIATHDEHLIRAAEANLPPATSSKCSSASATGAANNSPPKATQSASMSPSGKTGTPTQSDAFKKTPPWHALSPKQPSHARSADTDENRITSADEHR